MPRTPLAIASAADSRVADYAAVPDPAALAAHGLFVAEGRLVVRRLLASRRFRTRSLLVNEASLAALHDAIETAAGTFDVFVAPTDVLVAIAGFNFHRGCLALGERPQESALEDAVRREQARSLVVVLEGVSQADNVGSVFRNAAALGANGVLLDEACCDPFYRKALRTSMGTILDLPWTRIGTADLAALRECGYTLVALTPAAGAIDIAAAPVARADRVALLVGTEGAGLSPAWLATADHHVRIPMAPGVDSLNLATATGIALYALTGARQQREAY